MLPADFSSTLRYRAAAEPATLLADLEALRRHSQAAVARKKRIFYTFALLTAMTLIIPPLALVVVLIGYWFHSRAGRQVLDPRRLTLAEGVIRALECDAPPGAALELAIDFSPFTDPRHRVRTWTLPRYAASLYRAGWLSVSGKLADGSKLELQAEYVVTHKERKKTKGRKKTKESVHEGFHVAVRPAAAPALSAEEWNKRARRQPLPPGAHLHAAKVRNGRLLIEFRTRRGVRVTDKGSVLSGSDLDAKLAGRDVPLACLLCTYGAFRPRGRSR
jgi:hypothetical protein